MREPASHLYLPHFVGLNEENEVPRPRVPDETP